MPNCSVFRCKNRSATSNLQKDGVTFHMFPKDPYLRETWKKFCNNILTWTPTRNSVICSNHFKTSDFQVLANNRRKLVEGAKPSLSPHCICPLRSHQQSSTDKDSNTISVTHTVPDSLTSPCTSSTQNSQTEETSRKCNSIPTISFTPRQRKMQRQIDTQKIKIKRLQAKNLYLKKKVAGLEGVLRKIIDR